MRGELELSGGRRVLVDDGALDPFRAELDELGPAEPVRVAFAASRLVMRPEYAALGRTPDEPGTSREIAEHIDRAATSALRRALDAHGFGIAEAMDTAQRFAIGWEAARVLIEDTGALGLKHGFVAGAACDHLERVRDAGELIEGVVHQARVIQAAGGGVVLLPQVWLCEQGAGADEFVEVYAAIIDALEGPLILHWLGEAFHAGLAGYFPGDSFERILAHDPSKVVGVKLSLLDADFEERTRRALLEREQVVLTGDDHNFAGLILGRPGGEARERRAGPWRFSLGDHSHALLGVLDGIGPPAGLALRLLAHGRRERYLELMEPCEALGRLLFAAPTQHYKAGLAFLSWLDGRQQTPELAAGEERCRSREALEATLEAACRARVFTQAEVVLERAAAWLAGNAGPRAT